VLPGFGGSGGAGGAATGGAAAGGAATSGAAAGGAAAGGAAAGGAAAGGAGGASEVLAPTEIGSTGPLYQLRDFQPLSCGYEAVYGLDNFQGTVTVAALLAAW